MHPVRWNKRRLLSISLAAIVFYLILSAKYNKYSAEVVIKNQNPENVWNFVADFSKMKQLNPTIEEFRILKDHGNFNHWKYDVEYMERLSHWPHWKNVNIGHFSVYKEPVEKGGEFVIDSVHKTCFFAGLYCLKSLGQFKMSKIHMKDTLVVETVQYQCPPFMGNFCQREVEFQRRAILDQLKFHFESL
uniref:CSON003270 protein n=1 Tax=Culicoides sonorensis TaxID=179676 RepID=A0A336LSX5_CULSO